MAQRDDSTKLSRVYDTMNTSFYLPNNADPKQLHGYIKDDTLFVVKNIADNITGELDIIDVVHK